MKRSASKRDERHGRSRLRTLKNIPTCCEMPASPHCCQLGESVNAATVACLRFCFVMIKDASTKLRNDVKPHQCWGVSGLKKINARSVDTTTKSSQGPKTIYPMPLTIPSQACHRDARAGARPHPEAHAELHQP